MRTKGKLAGKIAIITGASNGIGAAIAKEYAAEGAAGVIQPSSLKITRKPINLIHDLGVQEQNVGW